MACPHRKSLPNGGVYCRLVDISVPKVDPCATCKPEWTDGKVPTLETPTPTLVGMQSKFDGTYVPPKPIVEMPSFGKRVMSALTAFAAFVKSGGKLLDADAVAERLKICDGCEDRIIYLWSPTCRRCGCFLRGKSQLPHERCPRLLWPGDLDKPPCGKPCGG